ncbi:hypothetical protein UY3_01741 [Chelonia mydas]|uniref:Secreted protein n=1 Tax=Chelonia mydas TaxID=8469 RepID=M7BYJ4_CHEMY|nr:hypothetical protein UY3_01741 [Chelonia mydas]
MATAPLSAPLLLLALVEFQSRQQSDRGSIYRVYTRHDKSIPDRAITTHDPPIRRIEFDTPDIAIRPPADTVSKCSIDFC